MTPESLGRPHLSVVIPSYNEEKRLGSSLLRIDEHLSERGVDFEILVIDDGSTDGTAELAKRFFKDHRGRVVRNGENRGKGYSVRRGALAASGRWVLMTDADLSAPIEEYAPLADAVRDHDLDVAIGSRALSGSRIEVRQNVLRETMGKTFNRMIRLMTGLKYHDTQCGFKLMDRDRTQPLFERMRVDRFAFDVELLFLCDRFGLRVQEVPVVWRNDAKSRVSLLADPINMIWDVARVRWFFRRGLYNPDVNPGATEAGDGS